MLKSYKRAGVRRSTVAEDAEKDISILPRRPALPMRTMRNVSRIREQSSNATRTRILDAAERLFAENGYDGTSIRDVAAASKYQIQAVSYHFGPKEQLFDTVIRRRAAVMTDLRVRTLATMRTDADGAPIDVARLIRAYVVPFIASAHDGNQGWRNYAALMGRLANSPLGTEVIGRHYDVTARAYIAEFCRSMPHATESEIIESFMFMVASMLSICADTGRMDRLCRSGTVRQSPLAHLERLVVFLTAGFNALSNAHTDATACKSRS